MSFNANCQSTGIGSLPFKEQDKSLKVILENIDIPFWPQLPKRSPKESMVMQFSEGVPCLIIKDKSLLYEPGQRDKYLEKFYERVILKDVDYFTISNDYAHGLHGFLNLLEKGDINQEYVKGQVTGPFSFAGSIKDKEGRDLLGDSVMMEVVTQSLGMKALWQINRFKRYDKKAIMFIDEPILTCFGSAYSPVNKTDVVKWLTQLITIIKSEGNSLIGIHCCGNTDWGMLLGLDIDIVSFDAFGFLDKFLLYIDDIKSFLQKNKIIAWGIVPTAGFDDKKVKFEDLIQGLENQAVKRLENKGLEKSIILKQSLITPSCGLGSLELSKNPNVVLNILELVKKISLHLKNKIG